MAKATKPLLLGSHGLIHPGETVPVSWQDDRGDEHATDFEQLAADGLIDAAPKPAAATSEPTKPSSDGPARKARSHHRNEKKD